MSDEKTSVAATPKEKPVLTLKHWLPWNQCDQFDCVSSLVRSLTSWLTSYFPDNTVMCERIAKEKTKDEPQPPVHKVVITVHDCTYAGAKDDDDTLILGDIFLRISLVDDIFTLHDCNCEDPDTFMPDLLSWMMRLDDQLWDSIIETLSDAIMSQKNKEAFEFSEPPMYPPRQVSVPVVKIDLDDEDDDEFDGAPSATDTRRERDKLADINGLHGLTIDL